MRSCGFPLLRRSRADPASARRRLDFPVLFAFGGAFIPVIAFARTILTARAYSAHFWARPHISSFIGWYPATVGYSIFLPLAAFVLVILFRIPVSPSWSKSERPYRLWYRIATL